MSCSYTLTMDDRGPAPRVRTRTQKDSSGRGSGSSRPNIADIAALANVSTSAVSYALNGRSGVAESTRIRILEIAESLNWRPSSAARALKVERANAIGIVNVHDPRFSALSSDFSGEFLMGPVPSFAAHESWLSSRSSSAPWCSPRSCSGPSSRSTDRPTRSPRTTDHENP